MPKKNFEPDMRFDEMDLSVYFYYWHDRKPLWEMVYEEPDDIDLALHTIWEQASFQLQINLEAFLKGKNIDCEIEYHSIHDIPKTWKKVCYSLCPSCKKTINIHLSRAMQYCPVCSNMRDNEKRRLTRAIKTGRQLCKYCGKPLPKKYPNRNYCCRSHKQMDWLKRKFLENISRDDTII